METPNDWIWPVEMLERILHFLAMDGAACTWTHLAYLTHKNEELLRIAERMERPLVLRVAFDGQNGNKKFILPFRHATVAQIEIDWGDHTPVQIISEVGQGFAEHEYKASGEYTVRVFPHEGAATETDSPRTWLNHLGWDSRTDLGLTDPWWSPLQSLNTFGSLGISSLEDLFFQASQFNLPLSNVDVSQITCMSDLFGGASSFDQPIGRWNVSNVTDMTHMFRSCECFNQDISRWDVSSVKSMSSMFSGAAAFNQPLGDWDTSNVTDMSYMFSGCHLFNQDISIWNVSKVESMGQMFLHAHSFNQPIGSWNVSNVKIMAGMFFEARSFNQPVGDWDVSSVASMFHLFAHATVFDRDIGGWNVSNVEDMRSMFYGASKFSRSCIAGWNLPDDQLEYLFSKSC